MYIQEKANKYKFSRYYLYYNEYLGIMIIWVKSE